MAYKVNEHYFKEIDTHNKAYILGFLAADAYLDIIDNRLRLEIHNRDQSILDFIKKELETETPIHTTRDAGVYISIQRKQISKDLQNLGFTNHKSKDLIFPNISQEFYSSFILGLVDGDGCVLEEKYGIEASRVKVSLLGTLPLLKKVKEIFEDQKIKCGIYKTKNDFTYKIRFSSKDSIKRYHEYVYNKTDFFLERKHKHFKFLNNN